MAAIPREKILARRQRLEQKQIRFKRMQEKLRAQEKKYKIMLRKREEAKLTIIGRIFLERMEEDKELKTWFDGVLPEKLNSEGERELFELSNQLI